MVLIDTSVWIDHLRSGNPELAHLLTSSQVLMHPLIIGELACGNLQNRDTLINLWQALSPITQASHTEALALLNAQNLMGKGIGFIDLHLLASVLLTPGALLWTMDRRLNTIAQACSVSFNKH
jgi:predicted nucleic acid-binding protein|tara:strand:+ start:485 stop:853 length:369 start_codon:yes stop_codon:yes gene_type:complete